MIVDVHAHHVPEAFLRRLDGGRWRVQAEAAGHGAWRITAGGRAVRQPLRARLLDLPRQLADMDACGIDVRVLSGWASLAGYAVPGAVAADYARASNEALAEAVASAPGRLAGLATVPLQAPAAAADVLGEAMSELRMPGAQILTRVGDAELDDPSLEPFWERAEALGAFLLVHPADSLAGRELARHRLDNLVGNPAETTLAIAHLVLGGVLERHPGLRICAVHAGGYLPFAAGRIDRGYGATPDVVGPELTRAPSEWLRSLHYDTIAHSADALALLRRFAGAERMLLGSDAPFPMGDPDPVATVRGIPGLRDGEREAVLGGTAAALLGLDGQQSISTSAADGAQNAPVNGGSLAPQSIVP